VSGGNSKKRVGPQTNKKKLYNITKKKGRVIQDERASAKKDQKVTETRTKEDAFGRPRLVDSMGKFNT